MPSIFTCYPSDPIRLQYLVEEMVYPHLLVERCLLAPDDQVELGFNPELSTCSVTLSSTLEIPNSLFMRRYLGLSSSCTLRTLF